MTPPKVSASASTSSQNAPAQKRHWFQKFAPDEAQKSLLASTKPGTSVDTTVGFVQAHQELVHRLPKLPEPHITLLRAPRIDPKTNHEIRCERPTRQNSYRLACEWQSDRLITHHYGHGGSGWTLCHGTVASSLQLFFRHAPAHLFQTDEPLVVVGGGVIGLLTAVKLAESFGGERVQVLAESFHDTTSHRAGGLLAPISLKTSPEYERQLADHAQTSFVAWENIADGRDKNFLQGARRMPVYIGENTDAGLDVYVRPRTFSLSHTSAAQNPHLIAPPRKTLVQFDTGGKHMMKRYDNIFLDTQVMMSRLHQRLDNLGVEKYQERISHFNDLDEKYVFNCTGLGARELAQDHEVSPVFGHLIGLGPQRDPSQLEYMIYSTDEEKHRSERQVRSSKKDACYFMPKRIGPRGLGVIGGTFEPSELSEREHKTHLADVLSRTVRFFDG